MDQMTQLDPALQLTELLDNQRAAFNREGPVALATRLDRINRCIRLLVTHQQEICEAVDADFGGRSSYVTLMSDIMTSINSLKFVKKNVKKWMKPERRTPFFPMGFLGAKAFVHYQPKGVVGIMTPWNVPVNMIFSPLADALGAGNRVMIKPSEFTPKTSELMEELFKRYFEPTEIAIVNGGAEVGAAFSSLPLDHIIFTGAHTIGKHVMRAAAENLVPVTLELGGKSPVLVSRNGDLRTAAERIITGKAMNGGQLCISPDYCFVPASHLEAFIQQCQATIKAQYPTVQGNPDYTSSINPRHYQRVKQYIEEADERGTRIVALSPNGEEISDSEQHRIALHLIINPEDELACMQQEIFGPVLNIKTYSELDEAISYINQHERPLALYFFGDDKAEQQHVLDHTISGGVTINGIGLHVGCDDLPFGGIGQSGMGNYRGRDGFKTFSHARGVYKEGFVDIGKLMGTLPPFGDKLAKMLESQIKE